MRFQNPAVGTPRGGSGSRAALRCFWGLANKPGKSFQLPGKSLDDLHGGSLSWLLNRFLCCCSLKNTSAMDTLTVLLGV